MIIIIIETSSNPISYQYNSCVNHVWLLSMPSNSFFLNSTTVSLFLLFFCFFYSEGAWAEHVNSLLSSLVLFVYRGNRMVAACVHDWEKKKKKKKTKHNVMLVQYNWTHYLCYFDCDDHDLFVFTHLDWSLF